MLFFNSEEKQILDLGLEKEKVKNKMGEKFYQLWNKQTSKQTNKYNNFEYSCLNFLFNQHQGSGALPGTGQSLQDTVFTQHIRVKGEMKH